MLNGESRRVGVERRMRDFQFLGVRGGDSELLVTRTFRRKKRNRGVPRVM